MPAPGDTIGLSTLQVNHTTRISGNTVLRRLLIVITLTYLLLCGFMYAQQEQFLFFPQPLNSENASALQDQQVRIPRPGALLHGWLLNPGKQRLIIFYGGNAEEISHLAGAFSRLRDTSTLMINYRGYGLSSGAPDQHALQEDALWISRQLPHILGYQPAQVILAGRSLGTGVAMYVASRQPVDGLLLVTPYDSIRALASTHYPWLPVGLLLKHPFDSVTEATGVNLPVQFILAESDTVVPHEHAERLAAALPVTPQIETLAGTNHNSIMDSQAFWQAVQQYLDRLPRS